MKNYQIILLTFALSFGSPALFYSQSAFFQDTIIDFQTNVIDFREEGLMENIRGGVLYQPSPADLKVGDIFIDLDGNVKKVANIQELPDETVIDTVQPDLYEAFLFFDLPPQVIVFNEYNLMPETLPPEHQFLSGGSDRSDISISKTFGDGNVKLTLGVMVGLSSGLDIGGRLPYKYLDHCGTWKPWKWKIRTKKGYLKADFTYDFHLGGSAELSYSRTKETEPILLYGFKTPAGISAGLGLFTRSILEGKAAITIPITFYVKGNAGGECTLDGLGPICWPTDFSKKGSTVYGVTVGVVISVQGSIKQKIYLGCDLNIFGFKLYDVQVGGGPYFSLTGSVSGTLEYDSKKGAHNPAWDVSCTGELGVFASAEAKFFKKSIDLSLFSLQFPLVGFTYSIPNGFSYTLFGKQY